MFFAFIGLRREGTQHNEAWSLRGSNGPTSIGRHYCIALLRGGATPCTGDSVSGNVRSRMLPKSQAEDGSRWIPWSRCRPGAALEASTTRASRSSHRSARRRSLVRWTNGLGGFRCCAFGIRRLPTCRAVLGPPRARSQSWNWVSDAGPLDCGGMVPDSREVAGNRRRLCGEGRGGARNDAARLGMSCDRNNGEEKSQRDRVHFAAQRCLTSALCRAEEGAKAPHASVGHQRVVRPHTVASIECVGISIRESAVNPT